MSFRPRRTWPILFSFALLFALLLLAGCISALPPKPEEPEIEVSAEVPPLEARPPKLPSPQDLRIQALEERVVILEAALKTSKRKISELEGERSAIYLRLLDKEAEGGGWLSLAQALSDRDAKVRGFAALKLGELGLARPVPEWQREVQKALEVALGDEVAEVREAAAQALGGLGQASSRVPLEKVLEDPSPEVRTASAAALGKLKAKESIGPLRRLLRDPEPVVRAAAISALGNLAADDADIRKEIASKLARRLEDESRSVRENAARALGKLKEPATVGPLLAALKDEDERVRWYAAASLGEIGDKAGVFGLTRVLKNDLSPGVRQAACAALGKIKDQRAIGALEEAFNDENSPVKEEAWSAFLATVREDPALLLSEGSKFYEEEDFARAAELLSLALENPPPQGSGDLWLKLARSYKAIDQWPKAAEAYKAAVENMEDRPAPREIRLEYVEALTKAGRGAEAIEVYIGLIKEAPEESESFWMASLEIIHGLYEKGEYEAVVAVVERLEASFPELGGEGVKKELTRLRVLSEEEIKKAKEGEAANQRDSNKCRTTQVAGRTKKMSWVVGRES